MEKDKLDKSELFWCVVGNMVNSHFLGESNMLHEAHYKMILYKARKEVYGN